MENNKGEELNDDRRSSNNHEKIVNVVFDEEMPTTDAKNIYVVPVNAEKQMMRLVEKIESVTEKIGYANLENIEKITDIVSDLRDILARIPASNMEIMSKISDIEQRINGLQFESGVDYTKLDRLENKFQDFAEKLDALVTGEEFVTPKYVEQLSGRLTDIENRMIVFQDIEEQRTLDIENKIDQANITIGDVSKLLAGMSIEQITEKLELLTEIDKRARNLEEIASELVEVSGRETSRFDRLDNFIDKTTIESENLREAIDEMRKFIDEFRKKSTKKDSIIKKNLEILNENVNALVDRVIFDALEQGDKRLLELEVATGISSDVLLKRLKSLAEIRVRLRGEGTDLLCSLIR